MAELPVLADRAALDDAGRLVRDTRCLNCGYNLRGLSPDGRCPECGYAVELSVNGDSLDYCNPAWVESLAKGTGWLIAGLFVGFLYYSSGTILDLFSIPSFNMPIYIGYIAIGGVLSLIGYWKVTKPDPSNTGEEYRVRLFARWGMAGYFTVGLGSAGVMAVGLATGRWIGWAYMVLIVVRSMAEYLAKLALVIYALRLAKRIPGNELAGPIRILRVGIIVIWLMFFLFWIFYFATAYFQLPQRIFLMRAFSWVSRIVIFIFGVLAFVVLVRYRRALRACATQARHFWAIHGSGGEGVGASG